MDTGVLFPRVKRPVFEHHHWPPSSAKNKCRYTFAAPYAFMVCTGSNLPWPLLVPIEQTAYRPLVVVGTFLTPALESWGYSRTNSMEHSPSWEANSSSANQEIPCIFWNPEVHYSVATCPPSVPILNHVSVQHPYTRKVRQNVFCWPHLSLAQIRQCVDLLSLRKTNFKLICAFAFQ